MLDAAFGLYPAMGLLPLDHFAHEGATGETLPGKSHDLGQFAQVSGPESILK